MTVCAPLYFLIYTIAESFFARLMLMYSTSGVVLYTDYAEHFLKKILPVTVYDFIVFIVLVWPIVFLWKKSGKRR